MLVPSVDNRRNNAAVNYGCGQEGDLERCLARLVVKESLADQRPQPPAEQGESVQRSFWDAPLIVFRASFIKPIHQKGE